MLMCRDLALIASDYLDGELTTRENLSVRMHLLMCRHCRSFIHSLQTSVDLMKGHSSQRPDEAFIARLDRKIDRALREKTNNRSQNNNGEHDD